jgi:hypothetical protein
VQSTTLEHDDSLSHPEFDPTGERVTGTTADRTQELKRA